MRVASIWVEQLENVSLELDVIEHPNGFNPVIDGGLHYDRGTAEVILTDSAVLYDRETGAPISAIDLLETCGLGVHDMLVWDTDEDAMFETYGVTIEEIDSAAVEALADSILDGIVDEDGFMSLAVANAELDKALEDVWGPFPV